MTDRSNYTLTESVTEADIPAMTQIFLRGMAEDRIWQGMIRNISHQDAFDLLAVTHQKRMGKPWARYFTIVENATG